MESKNQLDRLTDTLDKLTFGIPTTEEISNILEIFLKVIADFQIEIRENIQENKDNIDDFKYIQSNSIDELKNKIDEFKKILNKKILDNEYNISTQILDIINRISVIEDVLKDDDKIMNINSKIQELEVIVKAEKSPYESRDELEAIDNESEKLNIDAIKGLKKELEELKKKIKSNKISFSGFSYNSMNTHIIDDETPTGTINGSNTVFTIANKPSPETSLKVYRGGARQRITEDYTLSGRTITFVNAPQVGEIILVDYRI